MVYAGFENEIWHIASRLIYGQNGSDFNLVGGYAVHDIDPVTDTRTYTTIDVVSCWFAYFLSFYMHTQELFLRFFFFFEFFGPVSLIQLLRGGRSRMDLSRSAGRRIRITWPVPRSPTPPTFLTRTSGGPNSLTTTSCSPRTSSTASPTRASRTRMTTQGCLQSDSDGSLFVGSPSNSVSCAKRIGRPSHRIIGRPCVPSTSR